MNIHPLFVHFPIGLLVVYSILEIGAYLLSVLRRQSWLLPVKTFLLFVGAMSSFAAIVTGSMEEDVVEATNPHAFILGAHAPFAIVTTIIYIALAAVYIVRIFDEKGWGDMIVGNNNSLIRVWNAKKYIAHIVLDT